MTGMAEKLADPWWRLNNLYYIKDKQGNKVLFKPNWAQKFLYHNMWYLSIILKARQLGMTTFIQIFMLDRCLFNDNQNAGIVAHNKEDAQAFFSDKIKFAYDNLPDDLKKLRKATNDTAQVLRFSNGSTIRVGTSLRSNTYQYIHISEFGKLCARYPDKANEVITGTLNTIAAGQIAFIESTAEGPTGHFFDMCNIAEELTSAVANGLAAFTKMDWKFFFFPWWEHYEYELHEQVDIPKELQVYFRNLEEEHGIVLRPEQKFWYVKKAAEQQESMTQEYPSTPAEAFERKTERFILAKQMRIARSEKRICDLPILRGVAVNTFWDLGRNDVTAIWFHQRDGAFNNFIQYFEARLEDLTFYVEQLRHFQKLHNWVYGHHYLPHDVEVTDISSIGQRSRKEILQDAGLNNIVKVAKTSNLNGSIELLRKDFATFRFDREGCKDGLAALNDYQWSYDNVNNVTCTTPARTHGRNGADALRQFSQGYRGDRLGWKDQEAQVSKNAGGRAYAKKRGFSAVNPSNSHVV